MPLDADLAAFLERVGPNGFDDLLPNAPGEAALKRSLEQLRTLPVRPIPSDDRLSSHDQATAEGVPLRIYRAADAPDPAPVAIFLHGGGWVMGDLNTHDHICRRVAHSGLLVVSVDYRLAPEHPFPAALDDVGHALDWVSQHAPAFGADPTRIVAMGTSAGANLAAALTARDILDGRRRIAVQALAYPIIDSRMATRSYQENSTGYHLTGRQMAFFWEQYAPRDEDRRNPLASLAHAPSAAGLPPSVVLTAEYDVLRDEGNEFARRLDAAGVHVESVQVPGVVHGFLALDAQFCAAAPPALDDLIARTNRFLAAASPIRV